MHLCTMDFRFSDVFLKVLEFSRDEAVRTGWHNVCPDHIMLGILRHADNDACLALEALGVDTALFKECIDEAVFCTEQVPWEERESVLPCESAQSMIQHASLEAARCGADRLEPLHYLLAVCRISGCYSHDWLADNGVELRPLVEAAGIEWSQYGLTCHPERSEGSPAPDPATLAAAIEERIREGYTTDNPHIS